MNTWLHLLGLCLVPLLVHCSDGQGSRPCITSSTCDRGSACARTGSGPETFCMPECDLHSQCAQGELCLLQGLRTNGPTNDYASTCLSASLEPTVEGVACQERELEACDAKPECRIIWGPRLDLKMRCLEEATPAACVGPNVVYLNALAIGETANGEVYLFWAIFSPSSVTFIDSDIDHPLFSDLFEVQPIVWDWPECEPPASP
ncbi:MAG: hypothetical protein HKN10_19865 [Myxococcales bacterium]|nr:hypothetical protein [Myxococcales bacterium]